MSNSGSVDGLRPAAPRVIEELFIHRDAIARHLAAPMLGERQTYLDQLLALGHKREFVAERASMLRNVVEHTHSLLPSLITEGAIDSAARRWASLLKDPGAESSKRVSREFVGVARSWFRHLGFYSRDVPLPDPTERIFAVFVHAMRHDFGYLPSTIQSLASPIRRFLAWTSCRQLELSSRSQSAIDESSNCLQEVQVKKPLMGEAND